MIGVLALVRDEAKTLPYFFDQMQRLESIIDDEVVYSFYENDSQDGSELLLSKWLRGGRRGSLLTETLGVDRVNGRDRRRTQMLAMARNTALCQLDVFEPDVLVVIDPDIEFSADHVVKLIDALEDKSIAMACSATMQDIPCVFGDSAMSYYDSWAFIGKNYRPGITFAYCPSIAESDRQRWKRDEPIEAKSAFGGIAAMRYSDVIEQDAQWNGDQGCEHWAFCESMQNAGKIMVFPSVNPFVTHHTAEGMRVATEEHINAMRQLYTKYNGVKP